MDEERENRIAVDADERARGIRILGKDPTNNRCHRRYAVQRFCRLL